MPGAIHPFTVPKWGLTMETGKLARWHKAVGDRIEKGMEVCDVETEKIANGVEAPVDGVLRRLVAAEGDVLPIGALLAIIADEEVSEAEIDAAVAKYQSEAVTLEAGPKGPQPELIEVAGFKVRHLIQRGDKAAIVLVHGFGGNLENWIMNHGALAAGGHTVAALDLPGHGESSKALASGSLAELADVVIAYLDAMGLAEAHLVGHSMGAAVCLEVAKKAQARVKTLVLIAAAGLGQAVNRDYISGFATADNRKQLKTVMQLLFASEEWVTRQMVDDALKYKRLEGVSEALGQLQANALRDDASVAGELGKRPTLVIWGRQDQVVAAPQAGQLAGDGVAVHVLDGCGHMVQVEAADAVNRLIAAFVAG